MKNRDCGKGPGKCGENDCQQQCLHGADSVACVRYSWDGAAQECVLHHAGCHVNWGDIRFGDEDCMNTLSRRLDHAGGLVVEMPDMAPEVLKAVHVEMGAGADKAMGAGVGVSVSVSVSSPDLALASQCTPAP